MSACVWCRKDRGSVPLKPLDEVRGFGKGLMVHHRDTGVGCSDWVTPQWARHASARAAATPTDTRQRGDDMNLCPDCQLPPINHTDGRCPTPSELLAFDVQVWPDGWPKRSYVIERCATDPNAEFFARQEARRRYEHEVRPHLAWNVHSERAAAVGATPDSGSEEQV